MRYKLFGKSGLRVSELCLGTMTFGSDWGWGADEAESRRQFDRFAEAGGNFIDTADFYTNGSSEQLLGKFLQGQRDQFVVATKYTLNGSTTDPNAHGNHRKHLRKAVEDSLRRLNTDYIDLYWLHIWDYTTPLEEILKTLDALVNEGKIHYVGISDTPAWIVSRANTLAQLRGWTPFVGLQIEYSLIERTVERELLPLAEADWMSVTAWSPLGQGMLTGKFSRNGRTGEEETRLKEDAVRYTERNLMIADTVIAIAREMGASPAQVALAWLRQRSPLVIPIVGARTEKQLADNLGCLQLSLEQQQMERLNEASDFELGFPYDFYQGEGVNLAVYGGPELKSRLEFRPKGLQF